MVDYKSEQNSKLTTNIEATAVPVGPCTTNGLTDRKTVSFSHAASMGMSCQASPLKRTDSLNTSIQTQYSNEVNDLCPTNLKTDIKENEEKAEISKTSTTR